MSVDGLIHEVLVPEGYWFSFMPIYCTNITNVTLRIDGELKVSKRHTRFPVSYLFKGWDYKQWDNSILAVFFFEQVSNFRIIGKGQIDGRGYMWWMREFINNNPSGRPLLFDFSQSQNVEFTGVRLINSPHFYLYCEDIADFWFHDFEIRTDIMGQMVLAQLFGQYDYMGDGFLTLPSFPLNTDGIDFHGKNILVERVKITNFDDAVVVKPARGDDTLT